MMAKYRQPLAVGHEDGKKYGTGYGSGCFKGDVILLGDNKLISEIQPNDKVLAMTGEVKVVEPQVRNYDGEMVRLKATGILPIEATPEHPLLVWSVNSYKHTTKLGWKLISEIQIKHSLNNLIDRKADRDYFLMPIARAKYNITELSLKPFIKQINTRIKTFPLNTQTAWLLGLYVAEGSSRPDGCAFGLNKNETQIAEQIKEILNALNLNCYNRNTGTSLEVFCYSAVLGRAFVDWCGRGAQHKKIPDFILFHRDLSILKAFLDGYTTGDGHITSSNNPLEPHAMQRMETVSKLLALQLQQAYARLGIFAHIAKSHKAGIGYIKGRQVNNHESYVVWYLLKPEFTFSKQMKLMGHDVFLLPVRSIETFRYSGPVYNMETEDETYLVNNVIVHNCMGKVRWIFERTGILLTYQEVSALCKMWAEESGRPDTWSYDDTWNKLRELDEVGKLREEIQRFRKKKRATILMNYAQQEGIKVETTA